LADRAISQGCSVKLLEGADTAGQLYLDALLSHVQEVWPAATTLDGSAGEKGPVTILVPGVADWADQIFACGPLPMYKTMAQMAELKDRQVQISLEVVMGCGHGVCYGCTIRTKKGLKQVCKDGPVFDLDDIIWEEMES
jgi:dihydroorotate dehydrogenase electron transfer subunit